MVWNEFHFFSTVLGIQTTVNVLLPDLQVMRQQNGAPLPTLYLLHGLSDDHSVWHRQTRIESYARKYRMAVVMPAVNRSFYTDMVYGARYFTFISQELPETLEAYFPLSHAREGRFAAGNSMGGYGAIKLGLSCPERYAAVASLSGALEMEKAYEPEVGRDREFLKELDGIYGGESALKAGENNLSLLAERLIASGKEPPRMYIACGSSDFLFTANESFAQRFAKPLHAAYHVHEGESHTWDYWDAQIAQVIRWLELPEAAEVW